MPSSRFLLGAVAALALLASPTRAWESAGHRIVTQFALDSLPADFPAFVREPAHVKRLLYVSGLPDRWSHAPDLPLKHVNWPDHYLDVEQIPLAGLDPRQLPSFRNDFIVEFARARAAHPENFEAPKPGADLEHSRGWPGFLPWSVTESFYQLKTAFSALKVYRELGTPDEIANAEWDVTFLMGTLSHYVGDLSQPLHTTIHHDGWVGPNPHGYPTAPGFHTWIDSGLIAKADLTFDNLKDRVRPAAPVSLALRSDGRDPVFVETMDFLIDQNRFVEPLYQLELARKLGHGSYPVSPEGEEIILSQLTKGGRYLGALWLSAWLSAPPETYLRSVLLKRHAAEAAAAVKASLPAPVPAKAP
ncbi:MAG: hypothetical protein JSR48_00555 [Verrucomicrobia bacterium]|nr:hypothetical protein [Verrucomicrobiota bacterium]